MPLSACKTTWRLSACQHASTQLWRLIASCPRRLAPVTPEPSRDYLTSYAEREARERLQQRLTPRPPPTEVVAVETPAATVVLKAWVRTWLAEDVMPSCRQKSRRPQCLWPARPKMFTCMLPSHAEIDAFAVWVHFAKTAEMVSKVDKKGKTIEACNPLHASQSCRHHASIVIALDRQVDRECDPRAVPVQFAETEEAVREADKWSKIVEARLKETQSKGQLSDELKAQSDEARRLEIEARNEAKCALTPITCMLRTPSAASTA